RRRSPSSPPLPLGQALREYAGAANRGKLLALLLPVQRAAETCAWLRPMVDAGEIFHPLRWTPPEATRLLASVAELEAAGVVVRMPPTWPRRRPARPQVTATVGTRVPSTLGLEGLLDFSVEMTLDGERLSKAEMRTLLAGTDGLVLLRGQWVEVDRERLERTMRQFQAVEELARTQGLTFAEAMRMLAGAAVAKDTIDASPTWSRVTAGPWLADTLQALRAPDGAAVDPGPALRGVLRPYQKAGVQWLYLLSGLGLGACLADDMGLGKTIQVLSLLLVQRQKSNGAAPPPCLLVAPASLLANWTAEIERFAPDLKVRIVHPSAMTAEAAKQFTPAQAAELDLAITSYGTLLRMPVLSEIAWRLVILDEAQAIKNPGAKQTRAAKTLQAQARIALTGTPVENRLGDLWSIFDFINPGLLGGAKQFTSYAKSLVERTDNPYGPLRHRRPARQDRGDGALPSQPQTGGAVCGGGRGPGAQPGGGRGHPAQGPRADHAAAPQADLQPSLAVAERRRLGRGGQRQAGPAARDRRGGGVAAGEDAGLHPVPHGHCAAGGIPWRDLRTCRAGDARRDG